MTRTPSGLGQWLVRTDGDAVARARRVLDELEAAWRGRVGRMADLLAEERGG